ncbi:uncharacterized protein LOC141591883 isoform X2 [Silene latifolia]
MGLHAWLTHGHAFYSYNAKELAISEAFELRLCTKVDVIIDNEIIERASADKREAGLLGKKYEGKYKQVEEIASKLTIERAKFREYQERKMELQLAITNMVQGGNSDGILQVCADRIPSYFEELLKALSERCKKHGLETKSEALIELPKGWQSGIQEGAVVWDEE